jgi:AcrR family transcriptional regulator
VTQASARDATPARKSKALTIEAIEASASEIFCRDGYDRASLREIADRAGVSLSSIHEYFQSKTGLYIAVGRRLFEQFEAQRLRLLDQAMEAGREPGLETLLHCLVAPVVLPDDERPWGPQRMRTWYDTNSYLDEDPKLRDGLRVSAEQWIGHIERACPALGAAKSRLAYRLILSAMFSWTSTNQYFEETLGIARPASPADECRSLVTAIAAGIRALAEEGDPEASA